jgi:methylated-DNA-[protein]-cysteine S-methyltransferase
MPHTCLHTPLGEITLFEEDGAIVALDWGRGGHPDGTDAAAPPETPLLHAARERLQDYFDGRDADFDALALAPHGTAFQRRVWDALRRIPPGETRTYADIAREIGCRAARAIGQANGANPIPILIPCHRVVAAGGALGGYSGGEGPATKRYLLDLERRTRHRHARPDAAPPPRPPEQGTLLP